MKNEVAKTDEQGLATVDPDIINSLVLEGNIGKMSPEQKVEYYNKFCEHLGLNPITQPFQIIKFQDKEVLYATKNCTEQLRQSHGVSVIASESKTIGDVYMITVKVRNAKGREDMATGALKLKGLTGEALANAVMKCETKAKRRATLSICGLGMLDESEIKTIPGEVETKDIQKVETVEVNEEGEILEEAIKRMGKAKNMNELKGLWHEYNYMQVNSDFAESKDKRKLELEHGDQPAKEEPEVEEAQVVEEKNTESITKTQK